MYRGARALAARHGLRSAGGMALPHGAWPRVACVGPVDRNENGYDVTIMVTMHR